MFYIFRATCFLLQKSTLTQKPVLKPLLISLVFVLGGGAYLLQEVPGDTASHPKEQQQQASQLARAARARRDERENVALPQCVLQRLGGNRDRDEEWTWHVVFRVCLFIPVPAVNSSVLMSWRAPQRSKIDVHRMY